MQLPKYSPASMGRRLKTKYCQEPGCGKEYIGHPISKYCEIHRNIKTRKRKRRTYEDVAVKNQTFVHKFTEVTNVEFVCQLPGCNRHFTVKTYPKQTTYPKFCEEHRSEFKRINFMRRKNP